MTWSDLRSPPATPSHTSSNSTGKNAEKPFGLRILLFFFR